MLTGQRQEIIRAELEARGRVVAADLAVRFGVSDDTIRRDLRQMAKAGGCRRVYGGAVAPYAGSIAVRQDHQTQEKARLAAMAVSLFVGGQTVFLDAGSTNIAIARAIPDAVTLTVATNSLEIAKVLMGRRNITLIVLGGTYDPEIDACSGPDALAGIRRLAADVMVLGTCGLDVAQGATAFNAAEAEIKTAMIAHSERVIAAVTQEKLGTSAPFRIVGTGEISDVVLVKPDTALVAELETLGCRVHSA